MAKSNSIAKTVVGALGVVFILAGISGFIEPLSPDGKVFGLFLVGEPGTLHNMVHLLSGVAALIAVSSGEAASRLYAKVFGIVYALVTILGFLNGEGELLNILPINQLDNLLHLVITVALLYVGFAGDPKTTRDRAAA